MVPSEVKEIEFKSASYKPLKSLNVFIRSLHKSKSFWFLSEDEMCSPIWLLALARSFATHHGRSKRSDWSAFGRTSFWPFVSRLRMLKQSIAK